MLYVIFAEYESSGYSIYLIFSEFVFWFLTGQCHVCTLYSISQSSRSGHVFDGYPVDAVSHRGAYVCRNQQKPTCDFLNGMYHNNMWLIFLFVVWFRLAVNIFVLKNFEIQSNLLTGACNLSMATLHASGLIAMLVLGCYLMLVCVVAALLHANNVTLKFWEKSNNATPLMKVVDWRKFP